MKAKKILVFLRVSTDSQDLQGQKNEMRDYVKTMGYDEDDIIYLENKGASAIKLNDKYIDMINTLKDYIDRQIIDCVAVWHINRLGRSDEVLTELKNIFIKNKIQFICKNPSLVLLNEDGSVNSGTELAFGLFSILVKQDFEEKKAKFKRAKTEMSKKGMFVGGHSRKFGYKVDANNYLVEDEEESRIVRLVFQLYSSGEYSAYSLAKELNSRGYTRFGKPFDRRFVSNIIQSRQYTGLPDEKWNDRVYPPLISIEMFEKCRGIAEGNKIVLRSGKKMVLCSKLVKCPECGLTFTSKGKYFRCNSVAENRCGNNITLRESVVNEIAWRVAFMEHMDYLMEVSENNTQLYNERLEVIEQKLNTLNGIIEESSSKKKRIIDSFIEGYLDLKERDLKLSKLQDDILIHQRDIKALEEERSAILGLLENVNKERDEMLYYDTLDTIGNGVKTDEERYKIIHQHILKIIPSRYQHGERSKKAKGDNGIMIEIHTVRGETKKFIFLPSAQRGDNLLTWHDDKGMWIGERI